MASCLYPVAAALDGLPANQSLIVDAVVLDPVGGLRLELEFWKLTRLADKDGARIYSGVITRRSEESELILVIDDEGVKAQRIVQLLGITDARRTID